MLTRRSWLAGAGGAATAQAQPKRPNIILITAGEIAYADLGFTGASGNPTPHLDALARSGVTCSDGYSSTPGCGSTRAGAPLRQPTLSQTLSAAGYQTGEMEGNWSQRAAAFVNRARPDVPLFLHLAKAPIVSSNASSIAATDAGIGQLVKTLRATDRERNMLVFFHGENGGGLRIPFLVSWPGTLAAGRKYSEMVSSLDAYATACAAAGVPLPAHRRLDSVDLVPHLKGVRKGGAHIRLLWCVSGGTVWIMRESDFKLVQRKDHAPELYNVKEDIAEARNLAAERPDIVAGMAERLDRWKRQ